MNGACSDWFDKELFAKFHELAKCYVNQYDSVWNAETKMHLNGTRTFEENMADSFGLRAAYYSYKEYSNDTRPVQGYEHYNSEQAFLLDLHM